MFYYQIFYIFGILYKELYFLDDYIYLNYYEINKWNDSFNYQY